MCFSGTYFIKCLHYCSTVFIWPWLQLRTNITMFCSLTSHHLVFELRAGGVVQSLWQQQHSKLLQIVLSNTFNYHLSDNSETNLFKLRLSYSRCTNEMRALLTDTGFESCSWWYLVHDDISWKGNSLQILDKTEGLSSMVEDF